MLTRTAASLAIAIAVAATTAHAQHTGHDHAATQSPPTATATDSTQGTPLRTPDLRPDSAAGPEPAAHQMWMRALGAGWSVMGMAQVFPTVTAASAWREENLLTASGLYATQPAAMINVASPGQRFVLRTTLNFEGWTQRDGELTLGGWGEGFIDARHPHTLLHEAMVTANWWNVAGGALSVSAGKGFAPYGTDDPMGRPALKFPTNHHLSQVLERWTVNGAYLRDGWGIEVGVFGGAEPSEPYDFSNIESFGDSWSARLSKRFGASTDGDSFGPFAPWELSTSFARIAEEHHGTELVTELFNVAVRHDRSYGFGRVYALAEASMSEPSSAEGHYSLLSEALVGLGRDGRHQPYARVEYATRPEYEREGEPGTPQFFRYDHDSHEIGATRWLITSLGYGYESSRTPASVRPFVELQHNQVRSERGGVDPRALFGARSFWSVSAGARLFLGGGPMRMGSYGALDPMSASMRPRGGQTPAHHDH